jgi:hypothetical protein
MRLRLFGLRGAGRLVLFACDRCPARAVRFLRPGSRAVPAGWQATPLPATDPPRNALEDHAEGSSARRSLHECPRCSRGWQRAERLVRAAEHGDAPFAWGSLRRAPGSRRARFDGEERP